MPKKTRKEKIIAQLRRKLETANPLPVNYQLPKILESVKIEPISIGKNSLTLILKDLRKTFFLAGLAISFEFIVYWLTQLGGSKLLKFLPLFK